MTDALRHLCLVTHARYPMGEPRAERAAKAARDAGYHVHVVCLRGETELPSETIEGIEVRRLPMRHKRGVRLLRMVYEYCGFALMAMREVARLHRQVRLSLVQVHAPPDFLIVVGVVPRLLGVPLVLDIRDLSPHLWDARFGRTRSARTVSRILQTIERAACRVSDAVVTVHEPYRRELERHGIDAEKVAVVMNTPDESLLEPLLRDSRSRRNVARPFTVAYHGTITAWYGVDVLIDGVARARARGLDVEAVVLGEGDALEAARRLSRRLGVADHVTFSGKYVPIDEALRAVANADCGVIPNPPSELNRFILSNKLFEYVALGIPVAVAHLETMAAHFSGDEVTFFEAGVPESLADALCWIATHPDEAALRASRARSRAQTYAWNANRTRYVALLEKLAS